MKATILKVRWFGRKMWGRRYGPWVSSDAQIWRSRDEGPDIAYHNDGLSVVKRWHHEVDR